MNLNLPFWVPPLLGKARMMFWCDYSLLLVLAGCQNTHHRGVMNWVDGWQRVSDNSQRIWKSSHTLRYTFRFQSLSSKDKQSKTTVLSDFVSACLAMMCLRFEGNYHLANMSEWKKTMRGEREREPVTVIEHLMFLGSLRAWIVRLVHHVMYHFPVAAIFPKSPACWSKFLKTSQSHFKTSWNIEWIRWLTLATLGEGFFYQFAEDNGVGMLKEELKENLGRIARSGRPGKLGELESWTSSGGNVGWWWLTVVIMLG